MDEYHEVKQLIKKNIKIIVAFTVIEEKIVLGNNGVIFSEKAIRILIKDMNFPFI